MTPKIRPDTAIERARQIAMLLVRGACEISRRKPEDRSDMATLSILAAMRKRNKQALDPMIREIILCGSSVRLKDKMDEDKEKDKEKADEAKIDLNRIYEVGDIDLMLIDNGFYSNILSFDPMERLEAGFDQYLNLRGNLSAILISWFEFTSEDPAVYMALFESLVDLHVLPLAFFTDKRRRHKIAARHKDTQFFQNSFQFMMRFDFVKKKFVKTDLAYFEKKYECDLADLRPKK
jgi:hypothetical protein